MWQALVGFLQTIIEGIYGVVGNYGLSVILFTIFMRLALLPLDLKAKASTRKMSLLNPEIQKINEKYKNDQEKRNKKTMELYQKHQVNPMGGCLPMLLQLPLMFAMFAALRAISSLQLQDFYTGLIKYNDSGIGATLDTFIKAIGEPGAIKQSVGDIFTSLFSNPDNINPKLLEQLNQVAGVSNVKTIVESIGTITTDTATSFLNTMGPGLRFLWIKNVWVADSPLKNIIGLKIPFMGQGWNGLFILSGLAGITSYLQMKLTTPQGDNQQQAAGMGTIMPLMSVWFTSMYTSAFSLYWVTSNIFQIVQQLIYNRMNPEEKTVKEGAEK